MRSNGRYHQKKCECEANWPSWEHATYGHATNLNKETQAMSMHNYKHISAERNKSHSLAIADIF